MHEWVLQELSLHGGERAVYLDALSQVLEAHSGCTTPTAVKQLHALLADMVQECEDIDVSDMLLHWSLVCQEKQLARFVYGEIQDQEDQLVELATHMYHTAQRLWQKNDGIAVGAPLR